MQDTDCVVIRINCRISHEHDSSAHSSEVLESSVIETNRNPTDQSKISVQKNAYYQKNLQAIKIPDSEHEFGWVLIPTTVDNQPIRKIPTGGCWSTFDAQQITAHYH